MAAMVWPLMCRIFRMTMKLLLWIVRILERWLKRFDDKTVSFKEDPYLVPIEKVIEPVNLPDENKTQENVTRIPIPREPEIPILKFQIRHELFTIVHFATVQCCIKRQAVVVHFMDVAIIRVAKELAAW